MTITAAYQGVLNIPMYQTPYSLPAGSQSYSFAQQTGQLPIVNTRTQNLFMQQPYLGATGPFPTATVGVSSATTILLDYPAARTITIGSGLTSNSSPFPGVIPLQQSPFYYFGELVYPNMTGIGVSGDNFQQDATYSYVNGTATASFPSIPSRPTGNIDLLTNGSLAFSDANILSAGPITVNVFAQVGTSIPYIVNVGSFLGIGAVGHGNNGPVTLQTDVQLSGQCLNALLPGYGSLTTYQMWINPNPGATNNYIWGNAGSGAFLASVSVNYEITGQTLITPWDVAPVQAWLTDNAAINSLITASQANYTPCPNGMIFTPISTTPGVQGQYFVSKDGLRYWKLNLFAANAGGFINGVPSGNSTDIQDSIWIDNAGVVWYMGRAAQTPTLVQPMFSLALDIFYDPVILPAFPPTAFPCWSPCLDRIGGRPGNLNPTALQI